MKLRDPSLADVILGAIGGALDRVYTAMPGAVQDYDSATQTATVQPAVQRSRIDDGGERVPERMPAIPGVPVLMHGGGAYRTTYPIKPGDTGLLVFASCSIDKWLALGGEVDPDDDRRHHPSDAVFITGLRHIGSGGPLTSAPTDFMTVGADKGDAVVEIDSEIRAGKGASQHTVMGENFLSPLNALLTTIDTLFTAILAEPTMAAYFLTGSPLAAASGYAAARVNYLALISTFLTSVLKVK